MFTLKQECYTGRKEEVGVVQRTQPMPPPSSLLITYSPPAPPFWQYSTPGDPPSHGKQLRPVQLPLLNPPHCPSPLWRCELWGCYRHPCFNVYWPRTSMRAVKLKPLDLHTSFRSGTLISKRRMRMVAVGLMVIFINKLTFKNQSICAYFGKALWIINNCHTFILPLYYHIAATSVFISILYRWLYMIAKDELTDGHTSMYLHICMTLKMCVTGWQPETLVYQKNCPLNQN